jgi:hypothetical protein
LTYGEVYVVLPKNKAKIGICSEDDFFWAFDKTSDKDVDSMNRVINLLLKHYKLNDSPKTSKELLSSLDIISKELVKTPLGNALFNGRKHSDFATNLINSDDVVKYLDNLLNPLKNGIKVEEYDAFASYEYDKEVWTDSDCILIKQTILRTYIDKGISDDV